MNIPLIKIVNYLFLIIPFYIIIFYNIFFLYTIIFLIFFIEIESELEKSKVDECLNLFITKINENKEGI